MAKRLKRKRIKTLHTVEYTATTKKEDLKREAEVSGLDEVKCIINNSTQLSRPQCPQCGFQCWLCSTAEASNPGNEDPARWWSDSDEKKEVMETCSKFKSTIKSSSFKSTKTYNKPKCDESNGPFISIRDKRFAQLLVWSGIHLDDCPMHALPESINPNMLTRPSSRMIIELEGAEMAEISKQLAIRKALEYNELELRSYLDQVLVCREKVMNLGHSISPDVVVDQALKFFHIDVIHGNPNGKGPSVMEDSDIAYDYTTLEIDTTFMVSTSMFSINLQTELVRSPSLSSWLAEPRGASAYLTMGYKSERTGEPSVVARHQIAAAAAAIWLLLRKELRDMVSKSPEYFDLRHYGIILTASHFEIWEATIVGQQQYVLRHLAEGPGPPQNQRTSSSSSIGATQYTCGGWIQTPNRFKRGDMEELVVVRQREKSVVSCASPF